MRKGAPGGRARPPPRAIHSRPEQRRVIKRHSRAIEGNRGHSRALEGTRGQVRARAYLLVARDVAQSPLEQGPALDAHLQGEQREGEEEDAKVEEEDDHGERERRVEAEEVEDHLCGQLVVHFDEERRDERARERERGGDGDEGGGGLLVRCGGLEEHQVGVREQDRGDEAEQREALRDEQQEAGERELAHELHELPVEVLGPVLGVQEADRAREGGRPLGRLLQTTRSGGDQGRSEEIRGDQGRSTTQMTPASPGK